MTNSNLNEILKNEWNNIEQKNPSKPQDQIFNYFLVDQYVNKKWEEKNIDEIIIDGKNDAGIDIGFIDDETNTVVLMQNKNKDKVDLNTVDSALNKMIDYIRNVLNEEEDIIANFNTKTKMLSNNIQSQAKGNSPKPSFKIYFNTTALLSDDNTKIKKKEKSFVNKIKELRISEFIEDVEVNINGAEELNNEIMSYSVPDGIKSRESLRLKNTSTDETESHNVLVVKNEDTTVYLCVLDAEQLRKSYTNFKAKGQLSSLFSKNVREYVQNKKVDNSIEKSLKNDPKHFFIYNNGLTIIGKNIQHDGHKISMDDMCIINGAQTTTIIGKSDSTNLKDAGIFAKIIDVSNLKEDSEIISTVTGASNNQKPVKDEDFVSQLEQIKHYAVFFNGLAQKNNSKYNFQAKNNSSFKKEKANKKFKWISIKEMIKITMWSLYSLPGSSKSGIDIVLNNKHNYQNVKTLFGIISVDKNKDVFDFLQESFFLKETISEILKKEINRLLDSGDLNDEDKKHKEFYETGSLFILSLLEDMKRYTENPTDFMNYLEKMKQENSSIQLIENHWKEKDCKKNIKPIFPNLSNFEREKKLVIFLDTSNLDTIYKKFMDATRDGITSISNLTKKNSVYLNFLSHCIDDFLNNKYNNDMKNKIREFYALTELNPLSPQPVSLI